VLALGQRRESALGVGPSASGTAPPRARFRNGVGAGGSGTSAALAPGDLGGEGFQLVLPERAEPGEPGIDLPQRRRLDRIEPARPVDAHGRKAAVPQHLQVLRDGGLRDAELRLDHLDDGAGRMLAGSEQLKDTAPHRVAENIECVHLVGGGRRALPGVEGGGPGGGGLCGSGVRAGGDGRATPALATPAHEAPALGRGRPGHGRLPVERRARLQVLSETHDGKVPAHAHGAGAVLVPEFVVDVRHMLQLEPRPARGLLDETHSDPRGLAAVFPRHREMARRLARPDLAAGVALELVAAAEAQVARDREEPAREALGIGESVPQVVDAGVVGARGDEHARRAALVLAARDLARDGAKRGGNVDLHGAAPASLELLIMPFYPYISQYLYLG